MKKILILLSFFAVFLLVSCEKKPKTPTAAIKNVVKINNVTYTTHDLWNFAKITLWEIEPQDLNNNLLKEKILNDFIDHKLLLQEARHRNITIEKGKADKLVIHLSTRQGAQELKAITGHYNINAVQVARLAEERLIVNELFNTITRTYVTEAELRNFYETKEFPKNIVGEAHILHIFTTDNEKIQRAVQELAGGIIFSEVARKYSEGPERVNGGDLGYIKEAEFPEFFSLAFKLKEGEVSQIIQTEYGYHVFKMVRYANTGRHTYANIKPALLAELYTIKRQENIREFLDALHNTANIQYLNHFTLTELFPKSGTN